MRTEAELEEAFRRVGKELEQDEDDEVLQAIYETLRWCDGTSDFDNTIGQYLEI
jgi:hypothetical protein